MGKICYTQEELNRYLDTLDFKAKKDTPLSSVYFLINRNNREYPVYYFYHEGAYYETPCQLLAYPSSKEDLIEYVQETYHEEDWDRALEYEKTLFIDNTHYEINCPFCLSEQNSKVEVIRMMSERETLEWLLKHRK